MDNDDELEDERDNLRKDIEEISIFLFGTSRLLFAQALLSLNENFDFLYTGYRIDACTKAVTQHKAAAIRPHIYSKN